MDIRKRFSYFVITLFLCFSTTKAQGIDLATDLFSITSNENATAQDPSTTATKEPLSLNTTEISTEISTEITKDFNATTKRIVEPQVPTTTEKETVSNLAPLPKEEIPSTTRGSAFATDLTTGGLTPSTPLELTTPQVTFSTTQQTTDAPNSTHLESDNSTEITSNVTDTSTPALMTPDDFPTTTDIATSTIEDDVLADNNKTTSDLNGNDTFTKTTQEVASPTEALTATTVNSTFVTEMELNVTSIPELGSTNGTSPSTRNSTERFSDVDATPLHETASLTSSSSLPSASSTDSTSTQVFTSTAPPTTTETASKKWFMLRFTHRNCTEVQARFDYFKKQIQDKILTKAGIPDQEVTLNAINCTNSFLLNVSVNPDLEGKLLHFLSDQESAANATNKFHLDAETYLLDVIDSKGDSSYHQAPDVTLSSKHTDIEFVIYVALGSACLFLLSLAVILVGCKYCRTKPYKSFDLNDISNLSLRLEDYTLTRIPRPKSIYSGYDSGIANKNQYSPLDDRSAGNNGMVHSYDTSVVPLEDAPTFKNEGEIEPRIVGKSTQTSPTSHEYEEIDVKNVKSTENLHSAPTEGSSNPWGVDNVSFSTP